MPASFNTSLLMILELSKRTSPYSEKTFATLSSALLLARRAAAILPVILFAGEAVGPIPIMPLFNKEGNASLIKSSPCFTRPPARLFTPLYMLLNIGTSERA